METPFAPSSLVENSSRSASTVHLDDIVFLLSFFSSLAIHFSSLSLHMRLLLFAVLGIVRVFSPIRLPWSVILGWVTIR